MTSRDKNISYMLESDRKAALRVIIRQEVVETILKVIETYEPLLQVAVKF